MDHNGHDNDHANQHATDPSGPGGYMKLAGIEDGEYDALADLFLGESELAPEPFSQTGTDAVEPLAHAPSRLRMPSDSGSITATAAPKKVSIAPESPVVVAPRIEHTQPQTSKQLCVEAVLLGHLPVRASLWVRQYACSTARRRNEVVALIRAAAGSTSVDLIAGGSTIESPECSTLQEALAKVSAIADRVILRVDETTEPELLDREEIDEITILTGADEAAVVSSYRLIKTLTGVWDTDDESFHSPHVRLAVMGATGQQVADASAKLSRAVDAFLDRPIEIVDAAGRIDATGTTNIFRDTVAHEATSILNDLIEIGRGTAPAPQRLEPQTPSSHRDPSTALKSNPVSAAQTPAEVSFVASNATLNSRGYGSLIQGLALLETRCPFALDVEMCVDSTGSLHLVAGDDHRNPMTRLETVRAWVRDHLPLILRAEPDLAYPDSNKRDSEIELHLISVNPQSVRGLIDSPVRLYALAEVSVGGQTARVATPIN
tara:strand:+ start:60975 stop:62444 length:1470 start_codon:yes stop_codon:yes gene_type:complete